MSNSKINRSLAIQIHNDIQVHNEINVHNSFEVQAVIVTESGFRRNNSKMLALLTAGRLSESSSHFTALDPAEYCYSSVTPGGIYSTDTLENGKPKLGGLMDPRQSVVINHTATCLTCNGNIYDCPTHYGHIILAEPMYHIGYLTMIKEILNSFCFYCHKLLVSPSHPLIREVLKKPRINRLSLVFDICQHITICERVDKPVNSKSGLDHFDGVHIKHEGCGRYQPKIMLCGFDLIAEWRNPVDKYKKIYITAKRAYYLLNEIPDFYFAVIGMDRTIERPIWMILTVLTIPPLYSHRLILMPKLMKNRAYLITIYSSILETNNKLIKNKQSHADLHIIAENKKTLQYHIVSLINFYHYEWQPSINIQQNMKIKNTSL